MFAKFYIIKFNLKFITKSTAKSFYLTKFLLNFSDFTRVFDNFFKTYCLTRTLYLMIKIKKIT